MHSNEESERSKEEERVIETFLLSRGMAGASHWLWPEGSPYQVQKWKGYRTLILGKAPFPKKFDPVRVFNGCRPQMRIKQVLTEVRVNEKLLFFMKFFGLIFV